MRRIGGLLFALACALVCLPARADLAEGLRAHLEARGARRVHELSRSFLFEGESRAIELTVERATCVGLIALGRGEVRDIDLSLYTLSGLVVAEDSAVAPYAYARLCAADGARLYASVLLFAGRGEVTVYAMDDAPRELGRLDALMPLAVEPGGAGEGPRAMGGAPEESPFEAAMRGQELELAELGYVGSGPVVPLLMRGATGTATLGLEPSRCYRVVVLVPFARGVAATLVATGGRQWEARRAGADRTTLFVCTDAEAQGYELRIDSRVLRSVALVRAFEHPDVRADELRELGEARALGVAESRTVARARALTVEHVGEGWLDQAAPLAWPVTLQAGRCYGVWALGEAGLSSVDVRLVDEGGRVVARTEGPPHGASLYHCVERDAAYRLVLRPRGERGIVSLWLGRP